MNITQERHSLVKLWLASLQIVNRCTGKLLWVILISIVLCVLAGVVMVLAIGTSGAVGALQMGRTGQVASLGAALIYFVFSLAINLYGIVFFTVCCRLIANQALEEKQSLPETFSSSVLPSIYQIAAGFLLAIPMVFVGIIAAILARVSPVLTVLFMLALFFVVGVRLCYGFIAIAVGGKGPIEGIVHSWKMTAGKNFIDALLMILMLIGSVVLMYAFFGAIGYGLFIYIPLHFANSFSLAHPSLIWILLALVLGVIALFWYFVLLAFPVLVFLNRNAVLFDPRNGKDTTFVPLPALELPDIHPNPNPEHMQQAESTLRTPVVTDEELHAVQPQQPTPAPTPKPVGKQQPQAMPSLDGLGVSKSSINTSETDAQNLSEHLDQVYKPKPEDVVQYVDEDRMPTILFDDEMAKQLQDNQAQFAPKPKEEDSNKKDNGSDTIKMSKF